MDHPPQNTRTPIILTRHSGFGFPPLVVVLSAPEALRRPLSLLPVPLVSTPSVLAPIATGAEDDGLTFCAGLPTPRKRPCHERVVSCRRTVFIK